MLCEEPISTRWQLGLVAHLKAGFEGVRQEADTDTYMRFDRGQHGAKTSLGTQDVDSCLRKLTSSPVQLRSQYGHVRWRTQDADNFCAGKQFLAWSSAGSLQRAEASCAKCCHPNGVAPCVIKRLKGP